MYVTGTAPASFSEGLGFCAVSTAPSIPEMVSSGIRERTCGEYNGLFNCNYYLVMYMLNIIEGRIILKKILQWLFDLKSQNMYIQLPGFETYFRWRPVSSPLHNILFCSLFFLPTSLHLSIFFSLLILPVYYRLCTTGYGDCLNSWKIETLFFILRYIFLSILIVWRSKFHDIGPSGASGSGCY